jgi:hypothetical protein
MSIHSTRFQDALHPAADQFKVPHNLQRVVSQGALIGILGNGRQPPQETDVSSSLTVGEYAGVRRTLSGQIRYLCTWIGSIFRLGPNSNPSLRCDTADRYECKPRSGAHFRGRGQIGICGTCGRGLVVLAILHFCPFLSTSSLWVGELDRGYAAGQPWFLSMFCAPRSQ